MSDLYLPKECAPGSITYKRLAEHIRSLILGGVLGSGTYLPSVRDLASRLSVSTLTVQRAYADLARTGFTEAATHRGTWVSNRLTRSASREFLVAADESGGDPAYEEVSAKAGLRSLATAIPDPNLFEDGEFCAELADLRRHSKWNWVYAPLTGEPELLNQVSRLLKSYELPTSGDQLLITMGSTHGLSLLGNIFRDTVALVENPRGLLVKGVLQRAGMRVIPFSHNESGINLAEIAALVEQYKPTILVISPTYSVPAGSVLSQVQRHELLQLARKMNFFIAEMDAYRSVSYESVSATPMAAFDANRVINLGTFSYCLVPGLRTGYVRAPSGLRDQMADHLFETMICPPAMTQVALANYIAHGGLQRHLARVLPKYKARRDALLSAISAYLPTAKVSYPRGGFSCWVSLPHVDIAELKAQALEKGIAFTSGQTLYDSPDAGRYMRLCFGTQSPEGLRESIQTLAALIPADRLSA